MNEFQWISSLLLNQCMIYFHVDWQHSHAMTLSGWVIILIGLFALQTFDRLKPLLGASLNKKKLKKTYVISFELWRDWQYMYINK